MLFLKKENCFLHFLNLFIFPRYLINDFPGGSVLRIEPARRKREDPPSFECVAENGVGDPVTAKAKLEVVDGE